MGARVAILFLLCGYVNALAKVWAAQPRPFEYDPRVVALFPASGGGFPSGHTQNVVVFWGYLAALFRRTWLWVLAIVLMVLVPMSRLYLGVHFPTDLLGGYLIGAGLLLLSLWLAPALENWLCQKGLAWQILMGGLIPMALFVLLPAHDPYGSSITGTLTGIGLGLALESKWVGFEAGGSARIRTLRFLCGAVILFGLSFGLKKVFSEWASLPIMVFVRYGLIGLWCTLGAPWVFVRLGLGKGEATGP